MALLIGIDLGTTGCKAGVYDEGGRLRGESYLEYGLITRSAVMIEQDPHAWWRLTREVIGLALDAAGGERGEVRGLAVSSQGISFVLIDEQGRPLGNAINWLDSRATDESAQILQAYPAEVLFAVTGKRASPVYVLPKLLWLRRHEPETWRQARGLLMGQDYLVHQLCGARVTDHSLAGGTLLYDLAKLDWSDELLAAFDIPRSLLPELCWAGQPVGKLLPAVAEELGLRPDVVVSVGGQDQKCAALGAGIEDRCATISLGTASAIEQLMDRPRTDPGMRIPSFTFVVPSRWVLEGVVGTAAGSFRWYRDVMAGGVSYATLDQEAAAIPAGAEGVIFYPHLGGAGSPYWINEARGTFHGLSLATTRAHLTRAVLEGVAYQIRANLAVTEEVGGQVERVVLFGGGARSRLWREIIGDVLGRPVAWTRSAETAGLGAAMLAAAGSGVFASLTEARQAMPGSSALREPDAGRVAAYAAAYEEYLRVQQALLQG
jgi:xylulokinase